MNRLITLILPFLIAATAAQSPRAVAEDPATLSQHWAASLKAEEAKKYDDALAETAFFQKGGGDAFMSTLRVAWLSLSSGDFAKAEASYTAASKLQPAAVNPLLGQLSTAQALKDARKIERAAEAVLRVESANYRAQMALGALYFATPDYRKSLSAYRRALTNYPDDNDAMSGAAWAAIYTGDKKEAAEIFKKLLSLSPNYPQAQKGLEAAAK